VHVGKGSEICVAPEAIGIWVVNDLDNSVSRLDPATYAVLATTKVGSKPTDAIVGADGMLWVANNGDGTVTRIDPATDKVVDTVTTGGGPFVIRAGFGDVWTADFKGLNLFRLHSSP
jgi:YVTN family beta-propeller protein